MISIVVCDDHLLFGESFAAALRSEGARVSVASHPDQAIAALAEAPVDRVVMKVLFSQGCGLSATQQIRDNWPGTQVFCLGADTPELRHASIEAGAQAVLSKKRPLAELVETVLSTSPARRSGRGQPAPQVARKQPTASARHSESLAAKFLTNRERDVLELLALAQPTHTIANELGISVTTARGYVQSILVKLGVHSRVEAVAYAVRHSVVVLVPGGNRRAG
jgi:two-component system, NarL family, nitrate/nitrite response regulator NarL